MNLTRDPSRPASRERTVAQPMPGLPILGLAILLALANVLVIVLAATNAEPTWLLWLLVTIPGTIFTAMSLILVNPNQSKVLVLFGNYVGTVRRDGFFAVNPFTVRRTLSLRARNFNSDTLKVNDLRGNPIEIGAIVVWRVRDTAQAAFDVEDFETYVAVQSEAAIRDLAANHPYDSAEAGQTSLRGRSQQVYDELHRELVERLEHAGIEVIEVRLSHLAYAPEIAGAMLRRQQAEAIIDARARIVDGAVGMVQMALEHLQERAVLELDEERKASMVSNLLVVLCSERDVTPVVNTGTLYH